jgi:two-component system OmpR family response regulator
MEKRGIHCILLVEDDITLSELLVKALRRAGYEVEHTSRAEEALEQLHARKYDLLITDLMLPGMDGLKLIQQLRAEARSIPVLVLSSKGSVAERVEGLDLGADDYLAKPFAFDELLARVSSLLRRSRLGASLPASPLLEAADLKVDLLSGKVFRGGAEIELQPQEYALLVYLLRNKGQTVTRSMILREVWSYQAGSLNNVVESRICRLRNKIDKGFSKKLVQTIRGRGYVIAPDEE